MFGWFRKNKPRRIIVINAESLETRVALIENGRLEEFHVEHPVGTRIVGSIFKGKIQNLEHDLQAAFVDIGLKKNAFLHYWDMNPDEVITDYLEDEHYGYQRNKRFSNSDIERLFPPGSEILVQVTKGPIGTKGPRVTCSLSIPGRFLVLMPGVKLRGVSRKITDKDERYRLKKILNRLPVPEDVGLIVRTAADGASKRSFARDLRALLNTWNKIKEKISSCPAPCCVYEEPTILERIIRDWLTDDIDRVVIDSKEQYEIIKGIAANISRSAKNKIHLYDGDIPIFEHFEIEDQLETAFSRKVRLKSGAYIVLDETEAMITVDVNTGKHKGEGSQEQAILDVNLQAVEEVARQLRLRNIGGLVVIDLIDMKSRKHQNQVYKAFKAALKRDKAKTNVLPISELGLLQMTRQRAEESVLASMYTDCPYCKGKGMVKSLLSISVDIQRYLAAIMRKRRRSAGGSDLQVLVHPSVLERLRTEDEQFFIDIQTKYSSTLSFKADPVSYTHLTLPTIYSV